MFSPFQWAPYCSEATSNAACVALLQRNPVADTVLLQHRTFLIERLAYAFKLDKSGNLQITAAAQSPAQRAAVTRELTSWKTNGLQTYFQQLFHAMNAGHAPGLCMLQGLEGDGQQRMQTLHHTYLQIENLAVLGSCYALTALEESYQKLVEREALTRFTMEQSRRGHAGLGSPTPDTVPLAEVLEDVRRGRLPPILQHVQARNGEWIEFQAATPSDHPSPGSAGSHPASTTPPASSDPSVTRRPPFRRDVEPHHVALVMAEAAVAEVRSAASASGGACWDATAPRAGVARSWPVLWFR
ncbi:MAG: hypothetical protein WDW36_002558 [Sanguina aurantia]